jgi:hypothetical protein
LPSGTEQEQTRHALAQVIRTFKQGRIADRGHDAQQFRASGQLGHRGDRLLEVNIYR